MIGLKENVIIGKLIPAGTGMKRYRNVQLDTSATDVLVVEEEAEAPKASDDKAAIEVDEVVEIDDVDIDVEEDVVVVEE